MYKKRTDFDTEVTDYLSQKGYARRRDLMQYLVDLHKGDKDYSGYSEKSINRKLYSLIDRGVLSVLKYEDLKRFGIEEEDKRSSYLILRKIEEISSHIDTVIDRLSSDNPIIQKRALKELEKFKKINVLNPNQLDILIAQLDTEDIDLIDNILRIVYTYIDKRGIEPYNKPETIKMLRGLLAKYPIPSEKEAYKNLRTHFIFLLGHYNDYAVVERLKKDAEELDNLHEMHDYDTKYTANVIEEHREELYEFEEKLSVEGKKESADFIAQVRVIAMTHLGMHDDLFKENKDAVEDF